MIKFIIPAVIAFLIIFFWDKISDLIYKKFDVDINSRGVSVYVSEKSS